MSQAKRHLRSVVETYRQVARVRSALFHLVFPGWFLAALPGGVLTMFGTMLSVLNILVQKPSWTAGIIGLASLAVGTALLRYALVLRSRG